MTFVISEERYLAHYGVIGMRWGHHKKEESGVKRSGRGYSVDKDGRITIQKGFVLQRIYKKDKQSTGESGTNYFSFTEKDNQKYLAMMGAGAFSKVSFIRNLASNMMAELSTKEPLKSPSREEAFNVLNESLRSIGKKGFSGSFNKRGALDWYKEQNARIVKTREGPEFKAYKDALLKSGFNILLDEADAGYIAELPILVLDGERSLKKVRISDFSKEQLDSAARFIRSQNMERSIEEISKLGF